MKLDTYSLLVVAQQLTASLTKDTYVLIIHDLKSGKLISGHVNTNWLEVFTTVSSIVTRVQVGKLMHSKKKQELIGRNVASYLRFSNRRYESEEFA